MDAYFKRYLGPYLKKAYKNYVERGPDDGREDDRDLITDRP